MQWDESARSSQSEEKMDEMRWRTPADPVQKDPAPSHLHPHNIVTSDLLQSSINYSIGHHDLFIFESRIGYI